MPPSGRTPRRGSSSKPAASRHRLLRQPGGFEGLGPVKEALHLTDASISEPKEVAPRPVHGRAIRRGPMELGDAQCPVVQVDDLFHLDRDSVVDPEPSQPALNVLLAGLPSPAGKARVADPDNVIGCQLQEPLDALDFRRACRPAGRSRRSPATSPQQYPCLLYTSDAADDLLCV